MVRAGARVARRPRDVAQWLRTEPSLSQMRQAFPAEWEQVEAHLAALTRGGGVEAVREYLTEVARPVTPTPGHARPAAVVAAEAVRRQMTVEAVRQAALRVETGVTGDRLRLGLVNGWVLQRLLFAQGLRRKAVRLRTFRLLWPLLPQRRRLMPLVLPKGIYCFYSRPLIRGLAALVDGRPCLEIAAGDGTLARLLAEQGVDVTATDDHSWDVGVAPDDRVRTLDAVAALKRYAPQVVLCSWPPAGNAFEQHVFTTPSVQLYVVVTSRHEHAAGNWAAYRRQTAFELVEDGALGRQVLPPSVDGVVLVFRRIEGAGSR